MATLFVGQRVRIKYSIGWPELAGHSGTIIQKTNNRGVEGISEWNVAPDIWGSFVAPRISNNGATKFGPSSDQLEPLTNSNELVSWESMRDLWVPEHLRVQA